MKKITKNLLEVYRDNYEAYMFHRNGTNRNEIISKKQLFESNKLNHFEEIASGKNRVIIAVDLVQVNRNLTSRNLLSKELEQATNEIACVEFSSDFFKTLVKSLKLNSFSKSYTIQDEKSPIKNLKTALNKSELPYLKISIDFQLNKKSVFKIPVDVFKENSSIVTSKNKKLYADNVADWYLINHLSNINSAATTFETVSDATIHLKQLKINTKKTNVLSFKNSQNLLEFIQNQINSKTAVHFRLKNGSKTSNWVKIQKTETDVFTKSAGIYFDDTPEIAEFASKNQRLHKLNGLEKFKISSKSKLSKTTHFVPQKYNDKPDLIKFNIDASKVLELYTKKSLYSLPLVESKSIFFHLYFDMDLDWKSFGVNKDLLQLKKRQFTQIAGSKNNFEPLTQLLSEIYPYDKIHEEVHLSKRKPTPEKTGFHLVYKNIVLKNNEVQLKFLYDSLEKYYAQEMLIHESNETIRFLLQAILDEISISNTFAPALQIDLSRSLLNSLNYKIDFKIFKKLLTNEISVHLRSNKQSLSKESTERLIAFALHSIGDETLNEFFEKYLEMNDYSLRFNIVLKIAKRIRWEIMRKIHFFDSTAANREMGLRVLGNTKPNDPNSIYIPEVTSADTKKFLENHSIRSSAKKSSVPASFHYNFLRKIERTHLRVLSLKGLFSKEKIISDEQFPGLDIEFKSDKLKLPKELTFKGINNIKIASKLSELKNSNSTIERRVYDPVWITIKGNNHLIYPPKHRKKENVLNRHQMLFNNISLPQGEVHVRVRVFIPAPVVIGPFINDFGGDGRGPSFDAGTSRLDLDVTYNRVTGVVEAKQANWGTSHAYHPDTTDTVPGKPFWWLTTNAPPTDEDKLETKWGENVTVGTGSNNGNPVLEISYAGSLPLESTAPDIDGKFELEFNNSTGEVTINANHDGFPQHTLYLNEQLVYSYDPEANNTDPTALFPPLDIGKRETKQVPPAPSGQPSGGTAPDDEYDYEYDDDDFSDDQTNTGGTSWEIPFEAEQEDDGSVEISSGDGSDTLYYDDEEGTWESEDGMSMEGDETSFEEGMSGTIGSSEGLDEGDDFTFTVESTTDAGEHAFTVGKADHIY